MDMVGSHIHTRRYNYVEEEMCTHLLCYVLHSDAHFPLDAVCSGSEGGKGG